MNTIVFLFKKLRFILAFMVMGSSTLVGAETTISGNPVNVAFEKNLAKQFIDEKNIIKLASGLYNASTHANAELLYFLFKNAPKEVFEYRTGENRRIDESFVLAASEGTVELMEQFLNNFDVNINLIPESLDGSAFMYAVFSENKPVVDFMMNYQPDFTLRSYFHGGSNSVFRIAYNNIDHQDRSQNAIDIFRILVDAGALPFKYEVKHINTDLVKELTGKSL